MATAGVRTTGCHRELQLYRSATEGHHRPDRRGSGWKIGQDFDEKSRLERSVVFERYQSAAIWCVYRRSAIAGGRSTPQRRTKLFASGEAAASSSEDAREVLLFTLPCLSSRLAQFCGRNYLFGVFEHAFRCWENSANCLVRNSSVLNSLVWAGSLGRSPVCQSKSRFPGCTDLLRHNGGCAMADVELFRR